VRRRCSRYVLRLIDREVIDGCLLHELVIGNLKSLNELAKQARADHIIHTGDFGFYDESSLERIADKCVLIRVIPAPIVPY